MNTRILFYLSLAVIWLLLAGAIYLGYHERFMGKAEDWKQYLAMGICLLMVGFNLLRIYLLRQALARSKSTLPTTWQ